MCEGICLVVTAFIVAPLLKLDMHSAQFVVAERKYEINSSSR